MHTGPADRGANYNAFGYDPNGAIAYFATFFFGPEWVPSYAPQQFGGPPEPPRYGPPARYQIPCLPDNFIPTPPPNFGGYPPTCPPYLDPPADFHPSLFGALMSLPEYRISEWTTSRLSILDNVLMSSMADMPDIADGSDAETEHADSGDEESDIDAAEDSLRDGMGDTDDGGSEGEPEREVTEKGV